MLDAKVGKPDETKASFLASYSLWKRRWVSGITEEQDQC